MLALKILNSRPGYALSDEEGDELDTEFGSDDKEDDDAKESDADESDETTDEKDY